MNDFQTYILDHGEVLKLTGSGPIPIDADAELLALDAHVAHAMKHAQLYSAQKIRALSNQLHDLVLRQRRQMKAEVINLRPCEVRQISHNWPDGAA